MRTQTPQMEEQMKTNHFGQFSNSGKHSRSKSIISIWSCSFTQSSHKRLKQNQCESQIYKINTSTDFTSC